MTKSVPAATAKPENAAGLSAVALGEGRRLFFNIPMSCIEKTLCGRVRILITFPSVDP